MKLYVNHSQNAYFNLASEEYFIGKAEEDIILLWRSEPSVIIGKNQNAYTQVKVEAARAQGVKIVRRLTGGGAVFHDPGNLNFTFISPKNGELTKGIGGGGLDFAHFTKPIISALRALGLAAELSGRNDIVVKTEGGERKISGNAQCVVDGTTMHHGTLLFSANLEKLASLLNTDPSKLKGKGITSVRSRVANIYDLLPEEAKKKVPDVAAFVDYLADSLKSELSAQVLEFSEEDTAAIEKLTAEKYSLDEWNIKKNGDFESLSEERFDFGKVEISLSAREGRIADIQISGDFFGEDDITNLTSALIGAELSRGAIMSRLSEISVSKYIFGADSEKICDLILKNFSVL